MYLYHANDKNDDEYFSSHHISVEGLAMERLSVKSKRLLDKIGDCLWLPHPKRHVFRAKAELTNSMHDPKYHDDALQNP